MEELISQLPSGYVLDHYRIDRVLGEDGFIPLNLSIYPGGASE